MDFPGSWFEAYERLGLLFADDVTGREWVRQALEATWGVLDPADLERGRRTLGLQKIGGVVLALEDEPGDLAFFRDVRATVGAVFGRYFHVELDGPPWRLSPFEELPSYAEWAGAADFDEVLA